MQTVTRDTGYYWVKNPNDSWDVAHWDYDKQYWTVCWHKFSMKDDEFLYIDETKLKR